MIKTRMTKGDSVSYHSISFQHDACNRRKGCILMKKRSPYFYGIIILFVYLFGLVLWCTLSANSKDPNTKAIFNVLVDVWGFVTLLPGIFLFRYIRNHSGQEKQETVQIVDKSIRDELSGGRLHKRYYVTFLFPNQLALTFKVSELEYFNIDIGETGILTYRQYDSTYIFVRYTKNQAGDFYSPER